MPDEDRVARLGAEIETLDEDFNAAVAEGRPEDAQDAREAIQEREQAIAEARGLSLTGDGVERP